MRCVTSCCLQPRFVRYCRQACANSDSMSAIFGRIPALLVELSVAACQLHAASSFSSSSPLSSSSVIMLPSSRPLLTSSALIPLAANCVGTFATPFTLHISNYFQHFTFRSTKCIGLLRSVAPRHDGNFPVSCSLVLTPLSPLLLQARV